MSREQKNQLVNEVNILKDLSHEHIVKYYEHTVDRKNTYVNIFMEFCPGGDLGTALTEIKKKK
jgi:NIMA (never in mitosis gene a)-related kinase